MGMALGDDNGSKAIFLKASMSPSIFEMELKYKIYPDAYFDFVSLADTYFQANRRNTHFPQTD